MPDPTARLRFAIRWSGLSQAEVARQAGIPPQRITDVLAGRRAAETYLPRIAAALHVPLAWLREEGSPAAHEAPPADPPAAATGGGRPRLLHPLRVDLALTSWSEALVLWRLLGAAAEQDGSDGGIASALMQRLAERVGLDAAGMDAGVATLDRLAALLDEDGPTQAAPEASA